MGTKEMEKQESVDRSVKTIENILDSVVAPFRRPFKWVFNRGCYCIIDVQEGVYVCFLGDWDCPYIKKGECFRPQKDTLGIRNLVDTGILVPGEKYPICSKEPRIVVKSLEPEQNLF